MAINSNSKVSFNEELNEWRISDYSLCKKILQSPHFSLFVRPLAVSPQLQSWESILFSATGGTLAHKLHKISYGVLLNPFKTRSDEPIHKRLRSELAPFFNRFSEEQLQRELSLFIEKQTTALRERSSFYLMSEFAMPIVTYGIMRSMGIKNYDVARFNQCSLALQKLAATPVVKMHSPEMVGQIMSLMHFFADYYAGVKQTDEEGIISKLLELVKSNVINTEDYFYLCLAMFSGGFETTPVMICNGLKLLYENPTQLQYLLNHPAAIEEVFWEVGRLKSPTISVFRKVNVEVILEGYNFEPGQRIVLLIDDAHRNDSNFNASPHFNIENSAKKNLVFGGGKFHCLAHALGKTEVEMAIAHAVKDFPNYSIRYREGKDEKLKYLQFIK